MYYQSAIYSQINKLSIFYLFMFCVEDVISVEAPSIYIPGSGVIVGTYLKMFRTQNIKAYLGIRYAESTRFAPPDIDVQPWPGIFNATTFAPSCWQQSSQLHDKNTETVLSLLSGNNKKMLPSMNNYEENCLFLNIYVPDGAPSINGYAVIVWFHSGDFSSGSATDVDPFQLVFKQKVIIVTFSYRLNIFGFFVTENGESQGNFGLMDQAAALYWIKKNINYFGGDTNQITLMGHGSGAISAGLHLTSGEWSKDAFHKVILMSGLPLMDDAVQMPKDFESSLDMISNIFGCIRRPTSMLIQCLKRVDAKIIAENLPSSVKWGPVVDFGLSNVSYPFIEDFPINLFKKGKFHKVPVIIGTTDMEDALALFEDDIDKEVAPSELNDYLNEIAINDVRKIIGNDEWCTNFNIVTDALHYTYGSDAATGETENINKKLVSIQTEKNYIAPLYLLVDILSKYTKIFVYFFNLQPKTKFYSLPDWVSVPKYFDQIFVWGVPYMGNTDIVSEWNSSDKKISEIVMTLWANFAKTSNPTVSNVYVKWNNLSQSNYTALFINQNFHVEKLSTFYKIDFWNDYYPKVLQFSIDCCNSTYNAAIKTHFEVIIGLLSTSITLGLF